MSGWAMQKKRERNGGYWPNDCRTGPFTIHETKEVRHKGIPRAAYKVYVVRNRFGYRIHKGSLKSCEMMAEAKGMEYARLILTDTV